MKLTHTPTCPHCEYEFDVEETWESAHKKSGKVCAGEDEESNLTCPNLDCEKPFTVTCVHQAMFVANDE